MTRFLSYAIRGLVFLTLIMAFLAFIPSPHNFSYTHFASRGFGRLMWLFAIGAFIALFIEGGSLSNRNYISTRPLFIALGVLMMAGAIGALWWLRSAFPE